jgi:2-desacetyl-2-hydroxyethyl bacteriochlorophyllide A dehydrogenase
LKITVLPHFIMRSYLMKAARIYGPHDIRLTDVPTPEPGRGELVCRVVRAGICGTDHAIYTGEFSFVKKGLVPFPMTPGHEWSGVIEKIGEGVENFCLGDRVVGDTSVACGVCYECLMGRYDHCEKSRAVGTILCWDGAYAEYILMPARHVFHLPDTISFDNAAMVEPAATALYAVTLAEVKVGDTVLILGSGPIGISAAKLAKLCGASRVVIVGRKEFKLRKALDLGIDASINTAETPFEEGVRNAFGEWGVEHVVEASGSLDLFTRTLNVVKQSAVISLVAFYEKMMNGFDIDRFVFGDIKLRGVAGSLGMYRPVLRLMASGMLDLTSLITARYGLAEVPGVMESMPERNAKRIKEMIEFPE